MRTPPKVGERVALYTAHDGRRVGEVLEIDRSGLVRVRWNHPGAGPILVWLHPKQCRRLRPKESKRRRLWALIPRGGRTPAVMAFWSLEEMHEFDPAIRGADIALFVEMIGRE